MKVHIVRSPEYSITDFKEVIDLLKTHTNAIKINEYSNYPFEYSSSEILVNPGTKMHSPSPSSP